MKWSHRQRSIIQNSIRTNFCLKSLNSFSLKLYFASLLSTFLCWIQTEELNSPIYQGAYLPIERCLLLTNSPLYLFLKTTPRKLTPQQNKMPCLTDSQCFAVKDTLTHTLPIIIDHWCDKTYLHPLIKETDIKCYI